MRCRLQQQLCAGATTPRPPPPSLPLSPLRHVRPQLFSFRGKSSASIYVRGAVQAVAAVPQFGVADVSCWAVVVAGATQELRVYNESTLLSVTALKDHPSGLVPFFFFCLLPPPPRARARASRCSRCSAALEERTQRR